MFCTSAAMFFRVSASWMQPTMTTARTTPRMVPRPPKMDTPPNRTIGDDGELEAGSRVVAGGGEAQGQQDPGERADHAD